MFVYQLMVDLLFDFHGVEGEAILAIFVSREAERGFFEYFFFFQVLDFKNFLLIFMKFQIFIFYLCTFGAEVGMLYFGGEMLNQIIGEIIAVPVIVALFQRFISNNAVSPTRSIIASHYYNLIISQ